MDYTKKDDFSLCFMTGSTTGEHMHQDVEFIYVMDGSIRVTTLEKTFVLGSEAAMIINSNHRHSWLELDSSHVCVIHFDYAMLMDHLDRKLLFFYCNSAMENSDRYEGIRDIMEDLLSECAVNMDRMTFQKKSIIYRLLHYLVSFFMADEVSGAAGNEDIRIEKMLQYINTNYNRPLTLQEMAGTMYMAPSSFSRFFKKRVGITFIEYVNNVRLHFALEDIRYTNNSIAWIAETHGFTNASALCRIFRSAYGMSPMAFRKQMAQEALSVKPVEMDRQFLKRYLRNNDKKLWQSWRTQYEQTEVDCTRDRAWKCPWRAAMNLGNAFTLLAAPMWEQINRARGELGFTYGRIGGIFASEMLLRPGHGLHITNFSLLDIVLDFLVSQELRPVISLDNKPESILKGINAAVYERKSEIIFEDMSECVSVLDDFLCHIVHRYGMTEVARWKFECWYDEFYENTMGIPGVFSTVFNGIYRCIKARIPEAAVGGCGLSIAISEKKFRALIDTWSREPVRPDFISINLFPYVREDMQDAVRGKRQLNTEDNYHAEIRRCRDVIDTYGWKDMPLYVTEWNMSMSQRNFFNETCGKAALMLRQMCLLGEPVDLAAYLRLSDYSGVYNDTKALLMGGHGLMTVQGVCKPAYYALKFMNQMGRYRIYSGKNAMITTNGHEDYEILCFNAKNLRYKYYVKDENDIGLEIVDDIFEDADSLEITFTLKNLTEGEWYFKEYSIRPDFGSVLEAWRSMGDATAMDGKDVLYLKNICVPAQKNGRLKTSRGSLVFLQTLKAQEIRFIRIFR